MAVAVCDWTYRRKLKDDPTLRAKYNNLNNILTKAAFRKKWAEDVQGNPINSRALNSVGSHPHGQKCEAFCSDLYNPELTLDAWGGAGHCNSPRKCTTK